MLGVIRWGREVTANFLNNIQRGGDLNPEGTAYIACQHEALKH